MEPSSFGYIIDDMKDAARAALAGDKRTPQEGGPLTEAEKAQAWKLIREAAMGESEPPTTCPTCGSVYQRFGPRDCTDTWHTVPTGGARIGPPDPWVRTRTEGVNDQGQPFVEFRGTRDHRYDEGGVCMTCRVPHNEPKGENDEEA